MTRGAVDDRTLQLEVPEAGAGARLDRWLARTRNTGLSRNRLQQLIAQGRVLVNGRAAKAALELKTGDKLEVSVPPRRRTHIAPAPAPLPAADEGDSRLGRG